MLALLALDVVYVKNMSFPVMRVSTFLGAKRAIASCPPIAFLPAYFPHLMVFKDVALAPSVAVLEQIITKLSSSGEKRRKTGMPGSSRESNIGMLSFAPKVLAS